MKARPTSRGGRVIHGVAAVAALKLKDRGANPTKIMVIHGVVAVAALKRSPDDHRDPRNGGHPRRRRRGRIEATLVDRQYQIPLQVIHGVAAVAALKPLGLLVAGEGAAVTHGVAAVAA